MDRLKETIHRIVWGGSIRTKEEVLLTNERHHEALGGSIKAVEQVLHGLRERRSPELIAVDIREALQELGAIIGMNITEEILSAIFSKFCVGK